MDLTLLGLGLIGVFLGLVLSRRIPPLVAIALLPPIFGWLGGFGAQLGSMMLEGIRTLAPSGILFTFAILYFRIMVDVGLFDSLAKKAVQVAGGDPVRIAIGTALIALTIAMNGISSTTYLITISTLLPVYERVGMDRHILAALIILARGVVNMVPWGGPGSRAAVALQVPLPDMFWALLPSMLIGSLWVVLVGWWFGRRERARLGTSKPESFQPMAVCVADKPAEEAIRRPKLVWVNATLTALLVTALVMRILPSATIFMIGCAIALLVNYPSYEAQKARLSANAAYALEVVPLILSAGIWIGIFSGTKMDQAVADSLITLIPSGVGPHLALVIGLVSIPLTFFMSNDAFFFGVLPILNQTASTYDISAVEVACASTVGQPVHLLSPLAPSTWLLVGLAKVDFASHQKFTFKWALATSAIMLVAGALLKP